jgi:hypothetical protein
MLRFILLSMINNNLPKLSFLTKTELHWLLGNIQIYGNYKRKIKSQKRKRLTIFRTLNYHYSLKKE